MTPTSRRRPSTRSARGTRSARVRGFTAVLAVATAATAAAPAVVSATTVEVTAPPIDAPLPMKPTAVRVEVKNTGKRALRNLRFSVRSTKGVRVRVAGAKKGKTSRTLSTLRAGRSTRVTVRVQRLKGGPKSGSLAVRVQRGKRTVGSERLRFGVPPLTGRYFWGSTYTISGIDQETLYFAGENLVYTDDLEGAWPACPGESEQCRPYQYSEDGKALAIDGKPAEIDGRKISYEGQTYFEFGAPAPGTRWAGTLTYANSFGVCPLYCTYSTEHLQFNADGTFVRNSVTSGTGPVVDFAVVPPEDKGTYEVGSDKLLRLAFGDGTLRTETIGVYLDDAGNPKSPMEGMILNGDGYFDISKD
jgi:hypothetical protein